MRQVRIARANPSPAPRAVVRSREAPVSALSGALFRVWAGATQPKSAGSPRPGFRAERRVGDGAHRRLVVAWQRSMGALTLGGGSIVVRRSALADAARRE